MAINQTEPFFINEITVRLTNRRLITMDPDRIGSMQYLLHDFWQEKQHPIADELPLIRSPPSTILVICFVYWLLVRVLLPRAMRGREPFDLRAVMLLHNSFLIGLNGIGVLVSLYISRFMYLTWSCSAEDFRNIPAWQYRINAYLGYFYFLSKLLDFIDTFFFVLRKRYNQASFLHVFHHGLMPFASYLGLKYAPYFYSGFLPILNAWVHSLMYSYYALSCAGKEMREYIWWKRYMTQIQMIQFVCICAHAVHSIVNPSCDWPLIFGFLEAAQSIFFFFLFYSFYKASFRRRISAEKAEKEALLNNNNHITNNNNHNNHNNNGTTINGKSHSNNFAKISDKKVAAH